MRKNKSLPLIVASLLLAMSLSACNFELSLNGDGSSSSSNQTSSSSLGDIPNPTNEVSKQEFINAATNARKTNPGYQSADVTMFYYDGTEHNITAKFYKDADETEDWKLVDEESVTDYTYEIAGNIIEMNASSIETYSQTMQDNKYYFDDSGFKYVGTYRGENQGTTYNQEMILTFNQYGYCVYAKQTSSSGSSIQDTLRFNAKYSTSAPEGPSPTTDLSDSDWNTFVNNTKNINPGYKTATLDCTYYQFGGQGDFSANFDIVYTSTTGARGSWVKYSSGNDSYDGAFGNLINASPASFVNREDLPYKITYKYGNNTYFVYFSYSYFSTEARFNEEGYIIYAKNIEEDDDTRLEYFADVTYSLNEITTPVTPDDPGEDEPGDDHTITDKEWVTYASDCQKEALAYDTVNATAAKYLTDSKNIYCATLTNSTGNPSDWIIDASDGDDSLASYTTSGLVVRPIDCLFESFEGTIKYTSDGSSYRCDTETDSVKEVFVFDTKGNPIYLAHEVDGTFISVRYEYSNSDSGGEESSYDTTIREREDGQYMFAVGGDPTLGWELSDELLMTPTSIDEVSKVSIDVADVLQAKEININYLYMKTITLGTSTANGEAPIIIGDYKYSVDAALTFRTISATYDEYEQIYQTQTLYPSDMSHVENLTPETYFMPDWEEELDYYQMNCFDNPVSYEPGKYVLVMAGYDSIASKNNYSEAMALIRIDDVVSSIEEPKLKMGYDVVVMRKDASIDYHSLHINPENRQEFMVTNVYVEEGELIKFLNVPENDDFFITNLDTHSQGFEVYLGKIRCTQSGYYDFYATFSLDGYKVYIAQSQKA